MNTWDNSYFTIANPDACNQKAPAQMSTEWGHLTANYTKPFNINNLKWKSLVPAIKLMKLNKTLTEE